MAKEAYCEGSFRFLVFVIVVFTAAILAATFFVQQRQTGAAVLGPSLRPTATQATMVDGISKATPKGSVKLVAQTRTASPADPRLSPSPLENIQEFLNNVAATVKPAVVHIEVMKSGPARSGVPLESIGSGIIVDRRGYVLTNCHVIEGALRISLTTYAKAGPMTYEGRLAGRDEGSDLALVQIVGDGDFPVAKLGDSTSLEVGDWVLAMGSPLDLAQTVSFGIVSALRESVRIGDVTYADMIQTDAHINKGNSGGPLVNIYGEVIGINTAIYTPDGNFTGVGFSIPVNRATGMLDGLKIAPHRRAGALAALTQGQKKALKNGSWLGVEGVTLSPENGGQKAIVVDRGVYVTGVFVNSPAHRAGIQRGDILIWVDDRPINGIDTLRSVLSGTTPGRAIGMRVCRANQVVDMTTITTAKW